MQEFQSYLLGRRWCIWIKVKVTPWHALAVTEGRQKYSSKPITTLALEGVGGQHHALIAVPLENTQYPLYQRLAEPHSQFARAQQIFPQWDSVLSLSGSWRVAILAALSWAPLHMNISTHFISAELHSEGEVTHLTAPCKIADVFSTYIQFLDSLFPGVFLSFIASMEVLSLASISDSLLLEILLNYCSLWNLL